MSSRQCNYCAETHPAEAFVGSYCAVCRTVIDRLVEIHADDPFEVMLSADYAAYSQRQARIALYASAVSKGEPLPWSS